MLAPYTLIGCAFLLIVSERAGAIDFTPQRSSTIDDGIPLTKLHFLDGSSKIFVDPPNSWRISGSAKAVVFSPKDLGQATVTIAPSRSGKAIPFDEQGLESLRKEATELIPPNAQTVDLLYESPYAVGIYTWTGFEIMHAYTASGHAFVRSTIFINIEKGRQIRWVVDTLKNDFDKVYPAARETLTTWFEPSVHFPSGANGLPALQGLRLR